MRSTGYLVTISNVLNVEDIGMLAQRICCWDWILSLGQGLADGTALPSVLAPSDDGGSLYIQPSIGRCLISIGHPLMDPRGNGLHMCFSGMGWKIIQSPSFADMSSLFGQHRGFSDKHPHG